MTVIILTALVCLGLAAGLYAFSQERKMRSFADEEVLFLRKKVAARECELEELRKHLRANPCKVRAEANFDVHAFAEDRAEYVHHLVERLLHSLADNVAKTL